MLPADDPALQLLAGGQALVLAQVTSTAPDEALPQGSVIVLDDQGQRVSEVPLVPPGGNLLGALPDAPSFQRAYSAVLPGALVFPGMQIQVQLAQGQLSRQLRPRVGPGHPITLVTVPVRVGDKVGRTLPSIPAFTSARLPVSSVREQAHPEFTSAKFSSLPAREWTADEQREVLFEMVALRELEDASPDTHYVGSLPPAQAGGGGIATRPGHSVVVISTPTNSEVDYLQEVLLHELGHNFDLKHAACTGGEAEPDPLFPYPQAGLGQPGHYVFPYRNDRRVFIDPRDSTLHDIMSYCEGRVAFSDYNWLKMQARLDEQLSGGTGIQVTPAPLLSVIGSIDGDRVG